MFFQCFPAILCLSQRSSALKRSLTQRFAEDRREPQRIKKPPKFGGSRSAPFSVERHPPTNRGGRFSRNAETPSTKSFVFPDSICVLRSRSRDRKSTRLNSSH